jgi:hypothetical protein
VPVELGYGEGGRVVMIAHSQGCLLLRLALESLAWERSRDTKRHLYVFTFGNPSIHARGTRRSRNERLLVSKTEQTTSGIRWLPTRLLIWFSVTCVLGEEE